MKGISMSEKAVQEKQKGCKSTKKMKNGLSQARRGIAGRFGVRGCEKAKFLSENAIFYNSVIFKEK